MKTLTDKIIDEGKRVGVMSFPFLGFFKFGRKIMEDDNPGWTGKGKFGRKNMFYSLMGGVFGVSEIIYLSISLNYGNLDITKWSELQDQKEQQTLYQQNHEMKSLFYNTAGKDSVIDLKEFEEFYKKNFCDKRF